MNLIKVIFFIFVYINCLSFARCEDTPLDPVYDAIKKYDELIKLSLPNSTPSPSPQNKGLSGLLPNLDDILFLNWKINEPEFIWRNGDPIPDFAKSLEPFLNELGLEEILGQSFIKEGHKAEVFIYKFKDFTGAYSAFTILKKGEKSKLKIGKRSTEAEGLINFWKGNYFVDVHSLSPGDSISKEFVVLSSQDIAKNITTDKTLPAVSLQLPSLHKIQGSERYCTGLICAMQFLPQVLGLDYSKFNINQSAGIVSARYKVLDSPKGKNEEYLILARYLNKEIASSVFITIKNSFDEQFKMNKDYDIDFDQVNSTYKLKNKNEDYIVVKQKGILLKIAFGKTSLANLEKLIDLVP